MDGITGSGKTEVFINAVKYCISQNRSAIILLPEISLTPQIAGRFRSVFGEKVALWHSKLTKAQIIAQAATSMLAQANTSKQSILSLLQG